MYKLQKNSVVRLEDGACIPFADGNRDYEDYKQWVKDGGVPDPEFTVEELLNNAKATKVKELEEAFIAQCKLPIKVGAKTYNGGKESALAIRDYIQLVQESGGTSYTIWDSSNVIATYTLAEANAIKLAVATAVTQAEFTLRTKKNAVNVATTITQVNAVVF